MSKENRWWAPQVLLKGLYGFIRSRVSVSGRAIGNYHSMGLPFSEAFNAKAGGSYEAMRGLRSKRSRKLSLADMDLDNPIVSHQAYLT